MIKVSIEHKFRGSIELPENRYAKDVFLELNRLMQIMKR